MKESGVRRFVDRALFFTIVPLLVLMNFVMVKTGKGRHMKSQNIGKLLDNLTIYILLPIMLLTVWTYTYAGEVTSVAEISDVAEKKASEALLQPGIDLRVSAKLDERVTMPVCDQELDSKVHSRSANAISVMVHCSAPQPWTLYVPVKAERSAEVLVLASSLGVGTLLTEEHITFKKRDLGSLAYGYLTHPDEVIGKHLKRPLQAGWALSNQDIQSPHLIKRGDTVTLIAKAGPVEVRAVGKALSNAGADERIRVENFSTRRVVDGTVTLSGLVEVSR